MLSLKSFMSYRSLVNFELICIYSVGNLSLLFCELPFVSSSILFQSNLFSQTFLNALCIVFLLFMLHILFFRDDE